MTAPAAPALTRRTVVAGAAWSVPAIVAVTATPALAASGTPTIALSTPNMQAVAAGTTAVTAAVTDSTGAPASSGAVSFTGPSGTSFSPANATVSGGTATTSMTTSDTWATPGSTLTISATGNGANTSAGLTVLGANAYGVGANGNKVVASSSGSTAPTAVQMSLVFPSPLRALATGGSASNPYTIALLANGTVWAIGNNAQGQLGDGTTTTRSTWAPVPGLSGVTQVAVSGNGTSYALLSSGGVRSWGSNGSGALGNGSAASSSPSPVAVTGVTNATQVCGGGDSGYALLSTGAIMAWGSNGGGASSAPGQLGNNSAVDSSTPVQVSGISNATYIAAGVKTAYAVLRTGEVRSWGAGTNGELGNGSASNSRVPVGVSGITTATRVAGGLSTGYALLSNGQISSWGSGGNGQLGNGSTTYSLSPVTVQNISTATAIAAGAVSTYAKVQSGAVYSWGSNSQGQLGNSSVPSGSGGGGFPGGGGSTARSATPVSVENVTQVASLALNGHTSYTMHFLR